MLENKYFVNLEPEGGMTFVKGRAVAYRKGYQVATHGVECKTVEEANKAIDDFDGDAGVWFSGGIYYVDHSIRVKTRKKALRIGTVCHQQSILKWDDMSLIWLTKKPE